MQKKPLFARKWTAFHGGIIFSLYTSYRPFVQPYFMFFKLLLLLLVAVVALSAPGLQKIVQNKQKSQVSEIFQKSKQLKFSVRDVRTVAGRIPRAIVRSVKASAKSFVTSSAMLIPVGLVLNVGQLRPVDAWLLKGVTTGVEWAKVGAYFVVCCPYIEVLCGLSHIIVLHLPTGSRGVDRQSPQQR